jgi:hypothetical protein
MHFIIKQVNISFFLPEKRVGKVTFLRKFFKFLWKYLYHIALFPLNVVKETEVKIINNELMTHYFAGRYLDFYKSIHYIFLFF